MEHENNNEICCDNCKYFDERTHFCRLNPPVPIVFSIVERGETKQNVSSKYPVITHSNLDFCSHFEKDETDILINE